MTNSMQGPLELGLTNSDKRRVGNQIISRVVSHSLFGMKSGKIHTVEIFNQYSTIQDIFEKGRQNVETLLKWSESEKLPKWKWLSPIPVELQDGTIHVFDRHNTGWIADAYKKKVAISLMPPEQFLNLVCSSKIGDIPNDIRGMKYSERTIAHLRKLMSSGHGIDTPYLIIDEKERVFSHEGRHRAIAAMHNKLQLMPVYIYGNGRQIDPETYSGLEWIKNAMVRNDRGEFVKKEVNHD